MKKIIAKIIVKFLFLTIFTSLITSCQLFVEPLPKSWNWGTKSRPLTGVRGFPEADTYYGKGFRDGCESAWSRVGRGYALTLKTRFNYQYTKESPDYNVGWFDGFEQCTYIIDWDVT